MTFCASGAISSIDKKVEIYDKVTRCGQHKRYIPPSSVLKQSATVLDTKELSPVLEPFTMLGALVNE